MTACDFSSSSQGAMPSIRVSLEIDARARRNAVTKSFCLLHTIRVCLDASGISLQSGRMALLPCSYLVSQVLTLIIIGCVISVPPLTLARRPPERAANNCGHPANRGRRYLGANPLTLAGVPLITRGVVAAVEGMVVN